MNTPRNLSGLLTLGRKPGPNPQPSVPEAPSAAPAAPSVASADLAGLAARESSAAPQAAVDATPDTVAQVATGLVLYIGCIPIAGPHAGVAEPLERVVEFHAARIAQEQGVVDIRLLQYAAGKALLAASVRENPPTGVYYVNRSHELVAVALEALTPLADAIVQGVGG